MYLYLTRCRGFRRDRRVVLERLAGRSEPAQRIHDRLRLGVDLRQDVRMTADLRRLGAADEAAGRRGEQLRHGEARGHVRILGAVLGRDPQRDLHG